MLFCLGLAFQLLRQVPRNDGPRSARRFPRPPVGPDGPNGAPGGLHGIVLLTGWKRYEIETLVHRGACLASSRLEEEVDR